MKPIKLTKAQKDDNAARARVGEALVKHARFAKGVDPNTRIFDYDISDAITELFHFATSRGFNVGEIDQRANMNLEAELKGEE